MSLTTDFLANPIAFMRTQSILIPAQVTGGNGHFQFAAQGAHAAVLQNAGAGNIPGYYAQPVANNNNVFALPTQQPATYSMLTDAMNGCQFLAYGPDRQHITIEHNNFIGNPALYAARLNTITLQNHAYFLHLTATGVNNIPGGTYDPASGLNVVGQYTTANGWRFYVRDNVGANAGTVYGPL
ncbi:MAG TPA: hypothetical protein VNZ86_19675 [Bacteroidia bacterium]|jgi:hypothetical protein|nr:hypothetical protein [Bacteroidia bacterium]